MTPVTVPLWATIWGAPAPVVPQCRLGKSRLGKMLARRRHQRRAGALPPSPPQKRLGAAPCQPPRLGGCSAPGRLPRLPSQPPQPPSLPASQPPRPGGSGLAPEAPGGLILPELPSAWRELPPRSLCEPAAAAGGRRARSRMPGALTAAGLAALWDLPSWRPTGGQARSGRGGGQLIGEGVRSERLRGGRLAEPATPRPKAAPTWFRTTTIGHLGRRERCLGSGGGPFDDRGSRSSNGTTGAPLAAAPRHARAGRVRYYD